MYIEYPVGALSRTPPSFGCVSLGHFQNLPVGTHLPAPGDAHEKKGPFAHRDTELPEFPAAERRGGHISQHRLPPGTRLILPILGRRVKACEREL